MKGLDFARYHDIPDELIIRDKRIAVVEEKELKRDRTYEEFLEMFKDHIEGKVDANERVGNRPSTAEAQDARESKGVGLNESLDGSRNYQVAGSQGRTS